MRFGEFFSLKAFLLHSAGRDDREGEARRRPPVTLIAPIALQAEAPQAAQPPEPVLIE
ncbi:MAG: hypothetical protein RIA71_16085 [Oceanicaulis sp.]